MSNEKIEIGMVFRNIHNLKCTVVNIFYDQNEEVLTYKYWSRHRQRWYFETNYTQLFLVAFDWGWKWE